MWGVDCCLHVTRLTRWAASRCASPTVNGTALHAGPAGSPNPLYGLDVTVRNTGGTSELVAKRKSTPRERPGRGRPAFRPGGRSGLFRFRHSLQISHPDRPVGPPRGTTPSARSPHFEA